MCNIVLTTKKSRRLEIYKHLIEVVCRKTLAIIMPTLKVLKAGKQVFIISFLKTSSLL